MCLAFRPWQIESTEPRIPSIIATVIWTTPPYLRTPLDCSMIRCASSRGFSRRRVGAEHEGPRRRFAADRGAEDGDIPDRPQFALAITSPAQHSPTPLAVRILVVSQNYAPEPTSVGPFTTGLAEHFAEGGHETVVATTFPHYPEWQWQDGTRRLRLVETINRVQVRRLG